MANKYDNIFNQDFYPTPNDVLDMMQIDCRGLKVLEPSAGKGNILDYLKDNGAKEVFYCEINNDLAKICNTKGRFIKSNFLEVKEDEISHIQLIVMNPPFSEYYKHIMHAWNIASPGTTIISLCNTESIDYNCRNYLGVLIKNNGNKYNLGDCFKQAERQTKVDITCIHLFKPNFDNETSFEGFYMGDDDDFISTDSGIIRYDEIQMYVNNYIGALKCFDKFEQTSNDLNNVLGSIGFEKSKSSYSISYNNSVSTKYEFAKELQRLMWKKIFSFMDLNKYMTRGVMSDINKFIENQSNVPFTRKNIYKMIDIIFGTREHNLNRALVEAVDKFTQHTHENRFGVEGWKTNEGHLLNKKFIADWMFEVKPSYHRNAGKLALRYNSNSEYINDLIKVLCNLTGADYDVVSSLDSFVNRFDGLESGRWYTWGFFNIKGFKKGTIHLEFTDENVWWLLNKRYGEVKGFVLPEKIKTKK